MKRMNAAMSDLRGNSVPGEIKFGATGKIVGAIVVAIGVSAVGVYTYETAPSQPKHVVSANSLPSPVLPPANSPPARTAQLPQR